MGHVSGRDGVHAPDSGPQMWMPMETAALSQWRWVDWLRFFFYRFIPHNPVHAYRLRSAAGGNMNSFQIEAPFACTLLDGYAMPSRPCVFVSGP